jgi:uroporphyrinogen-III synthase
LDMAKQSDAGPTGVAVLLTRPEAQSRAFAEALADRFGDRVFPVISPVVAVELLSPPLPEGRFAGVIFTSSNGVAAAKRMGAGLPRLAWCVGDATARSARSAGFQPRSADGDAAKLVAAILADPPDGRLLHLHGTETRGEVAQRLTGAGIATEALTVYRQSPVPLTDIATRLIRSGADVIVTLFSPRSAAFLARSIPPGDGQSLHLAVLSEAVAQAVTFTPRSIAVALHPRATDMLDAVSVLVDRVAGP